MNIAPEAIERAITPKTRAIIPVHFAGLSCDMDAILQIAKKHNLKVIEDAAHAIPTSYKGKLIGTLESDVTVYSFYATKTLATGEGGMIVTRNPEIAARCRTMRLHGIDRDVFNRYSSDKPSWFYGVVAPGYKYNMTDIAASMGIHQLRKAWRFQKRRKEMAQRYAEAFAHLPLTLPVFPPGEEFHAWHLYVLRLRPDAPLDRNTFIERMTKEHKVGMSVHFIPLHLQPYWRDTYHLSPEDFPEAQKAFEAAASLPLYTKMTDADQERVIEGVCALLGKEATPAPKPVEALATHH
jgi:dTDP-4-amino-4,6-dideoxygalactose transaminase